MSELALSSSEPFNVLLTVLHAENGFCNFEVTDSNRGEYTAGQKQWLEEVSLCLAHLVAQMAQKQLH